MTQDKKAPLVLVFHGMGGNYGTFLRIACVDEAEKNGYVPDDASFGHQTFEVLSSRCKPGYAQSAIVNGLLDLISEAQK